MPQICAGSAAAAAAAAAAGVAATPRVLPLLSLPHCIGMLTGLASLPGYHAAVVAAAPQGGPETDVPVSR